MGLFDSLIFWQLRAQAHIDIAEGADSGTDWGSILQGVLFLGLGIGVIAAVIFAAIWVKKNSASVRPAAPPKNLKFGTRKGVEEAVGKGDYETAGDLHARDQNWAAAADAYARAGAHTKAARAFHESGNLAQAIHHYKKSGDVEQAARLYAAQGEHRAAAAEFYQAQDFIESAEQYALAGDDRRAGETYEMARRPLEAGRHFEKAEMPIKAAENFAAAFEHKLSRAGGELHAVDQYRKLARRAGELFREHGEVQRASSIFQLGGFYEDAATCLRTTGDLTKAAELLMRAKRPLAAAQVLEEAGDDERAAVMRAEAALDTGDRATAAAMFKSAGEFERAARLFVELENWGEAGEVYEELGDARRAYDLFMRANMPAHAARCAEVLEEYGHASELYRKAGDVDGEIRCLLAQGDYFRAGRLQFEHRRYSDALGALTQIDSRDPIYSRSLELQGDVYRAQGRFEKAYSRYRGALGNRDVTAATLPIVYKMARALEEEQDRNGALEHYNSILKVDKNYEDVSLRVRGLLGRGRRATMPGNTGSGLFSGPEGSESERRYEVVEEVARGGMGIVYRARDTVLGRIVAFKILGENLHDNETAIKYFLREARAAAALSHPNIVTIFDAGEQDGEYYMAMEFVEGTTLKELIKRKGALPEEQVRYILIHCCRALQYAHSKGIIHRDIKSGNVMITRDKALKIMDFGLAKFMREYQKEHTQQVGTPFYMSPEQIIGKNIDFRSDLYSLGCTIFECATGTVPFFKGDLSYHHVHTKPPSPRTVNPGISRDLERVILRLLEKNPDRRYQSAREILEAVAELEKA